MIKATIATLALACMSFSAHAENTLYSQRFSTCMNNSGGVTAEMLNCTGNEYTQQDARLNKAYKKLTSQLSAGRKKELLRVQRLWIQYRDANCKFYEDPDGGTNATINAASCNLEMTARRAQELENLME